MKKSAYIVLALLTVMGVLAGCGLKLEDITSSVNGGNGTKAGSYAVDVNEARTLLAKLPVKPVNTAVAKQYTGHRTDLFGAAWTDKNRAELGGTGCDTRNDILNRDLVNIKSGSVPGCSKNGVLSGVLDPDPYTGKKIVLTRGENSSDIQIDHIVALKNAWITGADQLTQQLRIDLANDPLNLVAADGPTNANVKVDKDASGFVPPNEAYRKTYVALQIKVKYKYHLWVTAAEKEAMVRVLNTGK